VLNWQDMGAFVRIVTPANALSAGVPDSNQKTLRVLRALAVQSFSCGAKNRGCSPIDLHQPNQPTQQRAWAGGAYELISFPASGHPSLLAFKPLTFNLYPFTFFNSITPINLINSETSYEIHCTFNFIG